MRKTVSISIGNMLFVLEDDAYAELERYLAAIRAHFGASPDKDEIVGDIESRIAEEFSGKISAKKKAVTLKDVQDLIRTMGTVEDFKEFDAETSVPHAEEGTERTVRKLKLYRDADDQIIGGVCSGLAKAIGIDPVIVRLVFGLSLFMGGFGAVLYLLLWFILPEARTTAEKVEMTGGRVTLSSIQQKIDDVLPQEKRRNVLTKIVTVPFEILGAILRGLGKVLQALFPILGRLIGGVILVATSLGIAAATWLLLVLLLNPSSPYIGFPLQDVIGSGFFFLLLIAGYAVAVLPLILILLLGASLVSLRNVYTVPAVAALAGTWFLSLVLAGAVGFSVAPEVESAYERMEAESTVEKSFDVTGFTGITFTDLTHADVRYGKTFSVVMKGSDAIVSSTDMSVADGMLSVGRTHRKNRCILFCNERGASITITMPALTLIDARDVSRISLDGFTSDTITLKTSDISRIEANVNAKSLIADSRDASHMILSGSAALLSVSASDISRIEASELTAENAVVHLKDVSRATLNVSKDVRGTASDISRLHLVSEPASSSVDTSGGARMEDEWEYHE